MGAGISPPLPIIILPPFPTGSGITEIEIPAASKIQKGDFIVSRYSSSKWAKFLPWEDWHHAALISQEKPLTIIEAVGSNSNSQPEGPAEVLFKDSVGFGKSKNLLEIKFLRPIFPNPIREIDSKTVLRSKRKIITEQEARERALEYARLQVMQKEGYGLMASKWGEEKWYCSLLIYKSYSRTVTGMYLEDYDDFRAGFFVTPEDLIDSPRSEEYFTWKKSKSREA